MKSWRSTFSSTLQTNSIHFSEQERAMAKNISQLSVDRRDFLKASAGMTVAAIIWPSVLNASFEDGPQAASSRGPDDLWYRRTYRWGQTNITEIDPTRYDVDWWRQHWKRTETQGVIINAGGIFAYYPSKFPLHHRAEALGDRDLYGELAKAAHEDGLAVLARMDSNRAHEDFYKAHPGWFTADSTGKAYRNGDLYISCVNSPYYEEYIPGILQEIIERSHPQGITDNNWSGLGRTSICYCENCTRRFKDFVGESIPKEHNWNDPIYRWWIRWNYDRRLEIWDMYNRITKAAGGADCLWIGMNGASIAGQSASFRDFKEICKRAEIIMLDYQSPGDGGGIQDNGAAGKLVHGLLGWDKLIPESMAMYQMGRPTFRLSARPEPEARLWMLDGFAGGLQPWWHHVGAFQEDRRMFRTAEPICRWHKANEQFLVNRRPLASVGVVWSQQNTDFYGRNNANELVELPMRGIGQALVRARVPYLPVHADHIDRDAANFSTLVLPNLAAMSDDQVTAVRRFVKQGGGLIATGQTSLFDEWGDRREDFALADLFGAHSVKSQSNTPDTALRRRAGETLHTYLRITPELGARAYGPKAGDEPAKAAAERHPVLRGFDETDILPFGGELEPLALDERATVLMTFIPAFPVYPPESAWMRQPRTNIPGLIVNDFGTGRVAFVPADVDRRFARDNLPDHGRLLANLVRWAAKGNVPLLVEGPGLVDCHLYMQPGRIILHMVNLTSAGTTQRAGTDELIPVGPLKVKVRVDEVARNAKLRMLVSNQEQPITTENGWVGFKIKSLLDHELVVFD
jgi:Hypothetical glycosyl hydrolase 6